MPGSDRADCAARAAYLAWEHSQRESTRPPSFSTVRCVPADPPLPPFPRLNRAAAFRGVEAAIRGREEGRRKVTARLSVREEVQPEEGRLYATERGVFSVEDEKLRVHEGGREGGGVAGAKSAGVGRDRAGEPESAPAAGDCKLKLRAVDTELELAAAAVVRGLMKRGGCRGESEDVDWEGVLERLSRRGGGGAVSVRAD